jgi:hypothetical protein
MKAGIIERRRDAAGNVVRWTGKCSERQQISIKKELLRQETTRTISGDSFGISRFPRHQSRSQVVHKEHHCSACIVGTNDTGLRRLWRCNANDAVTTDITALRRNSYGLFIATLRDYPPSHHLAFSFIEFSFRTEQKRENRKQGWHSEVKGVKKKPFVKKNPSK